jgi:pimeloyl-ACP methyl ester carboxylesterase
MTNRRRALRATVCCATAFAAVLGLALSAPAITSGDSPTSRPAGARVAVVGGSPTDSSSTAGASTDQGSARRIPTAAAATTGASAPSRAAAPHSAITSKPTAGSAANWPIAAPTDVVFVHGAGCGAMQYTLAAMAAEQKETGLPASTFHTVAYYSCDTSGDSILDEGSASHLPSPGDNDTNTEIESIAYELAWYLWDNFGSSGKPVDLVGHSMGGIVIAYAMQRIAAHDPDYPPSLTVHSVTTFSTPFGGVSASLCDENPSQECTELLTGSALLAQVDGTGAVSLGGQTDWTLVGSDGADSLPTSSTLALPGVTNRVDYTSPMYTHTDYLLDSSSANDASGTINGTPFQDGVHSLELLADDVDQDAERAPGGHRYPQAGPLHGDTVVDDGR